MVSTTVWSTKTSKAVTATTVQGFTAAVVPQCVCSPVMCVTAGRNAQSMMMNASVLLSVLNGVCVLDMHLYVLNLFRVTDTQNCVIWMPATVE